MGETLLFFGNERIATGVTSPVLVLQALLKAGYRIPAVVVAQGATAKSRKERALEVETVAETHGIPIIAPANLKEATEQLKDYGAVAGVLVAYGKIVPQEVIDIFPKGIINIHPSLLPKHRGPTPIESVILQGDKETGVSLMRLGAKMDAGPVYAQETILLRGDEEKQMLSDQLLGLGANMLIQYLPDILKGNLKPQVQNDMHATYDEKIKKAAGELDWQKPATELAREIRAYAGWPKSHTTLATRDVIITKAHVVPGSGVPGTLRFDQPGQLGVNTKDGVLVIDSLVPSGKKEMPTQAFLTGYPLG
jgi:methionyl-tRNA formyltransferase